MPPLPRSLALALLAFACARPPAAAPPAAAPPAPPPALKPLWLEAEDAGLHGVDVRTQAQGYSGRGYVSGFDAENDRVEFDFEAAPGLYELRVSYRSPFGAKGFGLRVNDQGASGTFQQNLDFGVHAAGKFELRGGKNRIVLEKGWGYYDIDRIELVPAQAGNLQKPPAVLVDAQATREARALHAYLIDIYGEKMLAGQQDLEEIDYVRATTGKEPAVGAFDLMEYSPSRREHGADVKNLVQRILDWQRPRPAIVSLCWHWNAPTDLIDQPGGKEWWRGFYTEATTFDLEGALRDPSSEKYKLIIRDLDAIAAELRRFQDARVPVLWRPLHEASGGWFWWGAKGPKPFVALWRLMFDRFVHHHQLHHLIWVYSPPEIGAGAMDWYPGDEYADIVGVDIYAKPGDSMSGTWETLRNHYAGKKLVALSESGTVPHPEHAERHGVRWSWFALWNGKFTREAPVEELKRTYDSPGVITRDELPKTGAAWVTPDAT